MSWFGWLLLAFSTFWVAGLVCIIFISIIPYCWGCLERRLCPERLKNSQNMFIRETLVTNKVVRHSDILRSYCTAAIEKRNSDDEDEIQVLLTNEVRDVGSDEESNNGSTITNSNDPNAQTCAICLDNFKVGESVSWSRHLIDCKHVFHHACIAAWLSGRNDDCPCCRRNYFAPRKESAMDCFGASGNNSGNDTEAKEINVMKTLSDAQFCVEHGLCLNPTVVNATVVSSEVVNMTEAVDVADTDAVDVADTDGDIDLESDHGSC